MKTLYSFLFWVIFIVLAFAISILVTSGIIKLICICFGLEFSWRIAIGIWLIMLLFKQIFSSSSRDKN